MFEKFLQDIAPYVIVVGSFARKEEHDGSDIDCYLRNRAPEDVNPEIGNDTFMPEILDIIQQYGFFSDSVLVGHIAVERQAGVPRMVEISSHYKIPAGSKVVFCARLMTKSVPTKTVTIRQNGMSRFVIWLYEIRCPVIS